MRVAGPVVLVLIVLAAVPAAPPSTSWAEATVDRLEGERTRAQELQARRAAAMDDRARTRGHLAEFEEELAEAQAALAAAERLLAELEASARDAVEELEQVEGRLRVAERRLVDNEVLLGALARDTYMNGHSTASPQLVAFDLVVGTETVQAFTDGLSYLERVLGSRTAVLEEAAALRGAVEQLVALAEQRAIEARRPARACHDNAAFDWLQANALRHGLYVLPSEAWHWSMTGR